MVPARVPRGDVVRVVNTQPDEMAIKNYPLMWRFIVGYAAANSGGTVNGFEAIMGTREEWESAERQLQHICGGKSAQYAWDRAGHLGRIADEGDVYLFPVPDLADYEFEFGQHGPLVRLPGGDVDYVVAMPYHILERYY